MAMGWGVLVSILGRWGGGGGGGGGAQVTLLGKGSMSACKFPTTCVLLTAILFLFSHVTIPKTAIIASYRKKSNER